MNSQAQRSREYLRAFITDVIGRQQLTVSQLHAQLACDTRCDITEVRLAVALKRAVRDGYMCQTVGGLPTRYYVPDLAYLAEQLPEQKGGEKWSIVKYDEGRFNGTILGCNFTEADARTCATALNERDRKVRAIKR